MKADDDLTKRKFGTLIVKSYAGVHENTGHRMWNCVCKCGSKHKARAALLLDGTTTRCRKCAAAASVANRYRVVPVVTQKKPPVIDRLTPFAIAVYELAGKLLLGGVEGAREIMELAHAVVKGT